MRERVSDVQIGQGVTDNVIAPVPESAEAEDDGQARPPDVYDSPELTVLRRRSSRRAAMDVDGGPEVL